MRRRREGRAASPGESHGETTRSEVNRPETLDSKRTNKLGGKTADPSGKKEERVDEPDSRPGSSSSGTRERDGSEPGRASGLPGRREQRPVCDRSPQGRLEGQTEIGEDTTRNLPEADCFPLRCVLQFPENKFKNRKRNQRRH